MPVKPWDGQGLNKQFRCMWTDSPKLRRRCDGGLARTGASAVIVARSGDQLAETVREIIQLGFRAIAVTADVSDPGAVERMVVEVEKSLGSVDLLVNNAGLPGPIGPTWGPTRMTGGGAWKSTSGDRCSAQGLSCLA